MGYFFFFLNLLYDSGYLKNVNIWKQVKFLKVALEAM